MLLSDFKATENPVGLANVLFNGASTGEGTVHQLAGKEGKR